MTEAVGRGHPVTALCRHPENVLKHPNVQARFANLMDTTALQRLFSGHDAIVHSDAPPFDLKLRAQVNECVARLTAEGRSAMEAFASYRPADPVAHEADVQLRIAGQTQATQSITRAAQGAGIKQIQDPIEFFGIVPEEHVDIESLLGDYAADAYDYRNE